MAVAAPLPPVQFDVAFHKALEVRQAYDDTCAEIRANTTLSDLGIAQALNEVWTYSNGEIVAAYADLNARRQARFEVLRQSLPVGPQIPAGSSPADAAVIQSLFRAALAEARDATDEQVADTLTDAQKYGDTVVINAALTALVERGRLDLVRRLWADGAGVGDLVDEIAELVDGYGAWSLAVRNAFAPIPKPTEVDALPDLQAAADAAVQTFNRNRGAGQRAMSRPRGLPGA